MLVVLAEGCGKGLRLRGLWAVCDVIEFVVIADVVMERCVQSVKSQRLLREGLAYEPPPVESVESVVPNSQGYREEYAVLAPVTE
jgi:hypothetical protein